jgi:hypothetical protein
MLVGVVVLVTLIPAGTTWAKPPEMGTDQFSGSGPLADCGDFVAYEYVDIDLRWVDFFDGEGNFVREQVYWTATGYAYNSEDDTLRLPYSPLHYKETYTASGEHTIVGLWVNVPGEGRVWHDAGRVEFVDWGYDLAFAAGQHDYWEGNTDALCAALTP